MKEFEVRLNANTLDQGFYFYPGMVKKFRPFSRGKAIIGGYFGDEGKGKEVDITAEEYKKQGYKLLSIRGQGSGNAGHTVVDSEGKKYDFHYLTSAGFFADIILLGPGMLIDPIRLAQEILKLPEEKRSKIIVAERATFVCDVERIMDAWCEKRRGQKEIGTTKSGVGPGVGNRGFRFHLTFADIFKNCRDSTGKLDGVKLARCIFENPILPQEIVDKYVENDEYFHQLITAINSLNIVNSEDIIQNCREEGNWAVLLEVSQAVCLDPLFGNGGHFCTSTPCTDIGGAMGSGLTMHDFPDGTTIVLKAYGSKVGGGPYITKFNEDEKKIDDFIFEKVGECGVTTGRRRNLGWFDGPAVRHTIMLTGAKDICVNCMDVITELTEVTDEIKICFAYLKKGTDEITYSWPYQLNDYEPLYIKIPLKNEDGSWKSKELILAQYILWIEEVIGQKITKFGIGPSRKDIKLREEAFK